MSEYVKLSISLKIKTFEKLEEKRGLVPRSRYIETVLKKFVSLKGDQP